VKMNMSEFTMGTFRGLVTAALLGLFVWLVVWAWSRARRPAFDAAARIPLEEDDTVSNEVGK
jgi:cytochrome c oxidase cbb3-type subunit 4